MLDSTFRSSVFKENEYGHTILGDWSRRSHGDLQRFDSTSNREIYLGLAILSELLLLQSLLAF